MRQRNTEYGVVDRTLNRIGALNHEFHAVLFEQFDEQSGDLVACFIYLVFNMAFLFAICGWSMTTTVPDYEFLPIIPTWFMIGFDIVFGVYTFSTVISHFADPYASSIR